MVLPSVPPQTRDFPGSVRHCPIVMASSPDRATVGINNNKPSKIHAGSNLNEESGYLTFGKVEKVLAVEYAALYEKFNRRHPQIVPAVLGGSAGRANPMNRSPDPRGRHRTLHR